MFKISKADNKFLNKKKDRYEYSENSNRNQRDNRNNKSEFKKIKF